MLELTYNTKPVNNFTNGIGALRRTLLVSRGSCGEMPETAMLAVLVGAPAELSLRLYGRQGQPSLLRIVSPLAASRGGYVCACCRMVVLLSIIILIDMRPKPLLVEGFFMPSSSCGGTGRPIWILRIL